MKSLQARCRVVTVVFVAILIASAIAVLADLARVHYLQGIVAGAPVDEARAEEIDIRHALIGLVQAALFLTCVIAFSMWFYRAHANLKAGGLEGLRYSPRWAVGGFFVPFLNLVRPFQVMKEVWAGSAFLSRQVEAESWRTVKASALVGWWWALFLLSSFLGYSAGRQMHRANEVFELATAMWTTLPSDLLDIPAALLALILVRRITHLQERALTPGHEHAFAA